VAARAEAVERLKSGGLDEALHLLDSPWRGVRSLAVHAIWKSEGRDVLPVLCERVLTEEDESVRLGMALATADLVDERARETLWQLLDDGSEDVRRLALRGLSRLGDERVVKIALSWYRTGGYLFRAEALDALAKLRTEAGVDALRSLLADESSWRRRRLIRKVMRSR
jgi:HEAT repeat protein